MTHIRPTPLLALLLVGALALAGCSAENPVAPVGSGGDATEVSDTTPNPLREVLIEYGGPGDLQDLAVFDKTPLLPPPTLLATQAARAQFAIETGSTWAEQTDFWLDPDGDGGFIVSWLEDDPEEWDPDHKICNVIADYPYGDISLYEEIDPNLQYIDSAVSRILNIIRGPSGLIGLSYLDGAFHDYHFAYPDPTKPVLEYRIFRLLRFKIVFLSP